MSLHTHRAPSKPIRFVLRKELSRFETFPLRETRRLAIYFTKPREVATQGVVQARAARTRVAIALKLGAFLVLPFCLGLMLKLA